MTTSVVLVLEVASPTYSWSTGAIKSSTSNPTCELAPGRSAAAPVQVWAFQGDEMHGNCLSEKQRGPISSPQGS
jgi:hypothetical protein